MAKKRGGVSVVRNGKVVNSRENLESLKLPLRGVTVIRNGRPYNSRVGYLDKK